MVDGVLEPESGYAVIDTGLSIAAGEPGSMANNATSRLHVQSLHGGPNQPRPVAPTAKSAQHWVETIARD
jgi:hypothetical protein